MPLGRIIKNLRIARDLSRDQLAGDEYSNSHIASVEQGAKRPSIRVLSCVADRLEVPLWGLAEELLQEYEVPGPELVELAEQLVDRLHYSEASVVIDKAREQIDVMPQHCRAAMIKAEAEIQLFGEKYRSALHLYHRYRRMVEGGEADAQVAEACYHIGRVHFRAERYRDSLYWFSVSATKIHPVRGQHRRLARKILRMYGQALLADDRAELGRWAFEHLLEVSDKGETDCIYARYGAGLCALESGDYRDACGHLKKAVRAVERCPQLQHRLAAVQMQLGRALMLKGAHTEATRQLERSYRNLQCLRTVNVALECLLSANPPPAPELSAWTDRVTDEMWSAAGDEQRVLHRCLRAEIAQGRGYPGEALDDALQALEFAPDEDLSLTLRVLSVLLRGAVTRGELQICREIADDLKAVGKAELNSVEGVALW